MAKESSAERHHTALRLRNRSAPIAAQQQGVSGWLEKLVAKVGRRGYRQDDIR